MKKFKGQGSKSAVKGQKSEVMGKRTEEQRSKFKDQRSNSKVREETEKVQDSKFKVQGRKFEPREENLRSGDRKPHSAVGAQNSEPRPQNSVASTQNSALIYGVLPVLEALRAGTRRIDRLLIAEGAHERRVSEIVGLAKENRVPFQKVPRSNLSRVVEEGANHQGVVAFVAAADYTDADELFEEIAAKDDALAIVLDGVEDPRNLGAILRTVDCVGADGVFIPERRAVGLTETVAKTSAGATEYVKIAKVTNISRLIDDMKEKNIWTVGTSSDAKMDYTGWDWTQKCALVLGSEGKGLHRLVAEKCDVLVKIPLLGKIESLNVSVAAGVILYEAVRQRNQKAKDEESKTNGEE